MNGGVALPDTPEVIEIVVEAEATDDEIAAVEAVAASLPYCTKIIPGYNRKSIDTALPWIALISAMAIGSFLNGFFQEAGADAYRACKKWVDELAEARTKTTGRSGSIIFIDPDTSCWVYLEDGLPEEAYRSLNRIDLREYDLGVRYQSESGQWVEIGE